MKIKTFISTFFICVLLFYGNDLIAGGKGDKDGKDDKKSRKDTTTAVVMYGNNFVIGAGWDQYQKHFDEHIEQLLEQDSISGVDLETMEFCKRLNLKKPRELELMLDSLFRLDRIPYALINEINFQIAYNDYKKNEVDFDFMIPYDNSPYPANYFYQSWNTTQPNPYSYKLSENDTTVMLLLRDQKMNCEFSMPFEGVVTSKYGWRDGRNHCGYDIDLEVWEPVKASFGGVVRMASYYGAYGRLVVVRHYNGLETYYAHLHRFKVKPGDIVEAGDLVGLGGSSGRSTGSHLHFEMRFKGVPLNPGHIISFKNNELLSDTLILKKTKWGYNAFPKGVKLHYVKSGESITDLARKYGISIDEICAFNGIHPRAYLRRGQRIMIKN